MPLIKHGSDDFLALKLILENLHQPEKLDSHPWTESLFVQEALVKNPKLVDQSAGNRLLIAIAELFYETMPISPPKHGVRLDARWSKFGFLAAKYFSPILFGTPTPASFQDAWEKIDQSILLFAFRNAKTEPRDDEIEPFLLIGNEPDVTPVSTLSDWHRKGLQGLLEFIQIRENYLSVSISEEKKRSELASTLLPSKTPWKHYLWRSLAMLFLFFLFLGGRKAFVIYKAGMLVYEDVTQLEGSIDPLPALNDIEGIGYLLEDLHGDLASFRHEVDPLLWLAPSMNWVPKYGCEIASAQDFLDMATSLTDMSIVSYQAGQPFLRVLKSDAIELDPVILTEMLVQAQPQFLSARISFDSALIAREKINTECLSPYVHEMLVDKIDPLLALANDGLTLAVEFPRLLGATSEGPKTYLLLVQNEDELRPTGGFITAASTLLLQNGQIGNLNFEDSGDLDNWEKPYPIAPWQLQEYMDSPVLVFRDANWFTEFSKSALYAESLYSYISNHSVDGVIAFDQQIVVKILTVSGPIHLEDAPYPIDAGNVISFMRSEKTRNSESDLNDPDWDNKDFINDISVVLIAKILKGELPWDELASVFINALEEHHLLLQLDNPSMTSLLARRGWDGSLQPGSSDFLMVVDSNIGFNKTNTLIQTSLTYDVDLTDLTTPIGSLTVSHRNSADSKVPCVQWHGLTLEGQRDYPIDRCYWDYLRIYKPSGTELLEASPQAIPADWMIRREAVPARVDILDEEIDGVQGFGTLKVVPGGQSITTSFQFELPGRVVKKQTDSEKKIYDLKIQKQPGTIAIPMTVRVHFPNNTVFDVVPPGVVIDDDNILLEINLREDREIEIIFQSP